VFVKSKPVEHILPSQATDRIQDLDILRGFALFGVILVNVFYFNAPDAYFDLYYGQYNDPVNMSIMYAHNWFFTGKFYPIFSFLFGLGFSIQFVRALQKRNNPYVFLLRRLTILLLFGFAHIIFVWENDILFIYAVFGFVLLTVMGRSSKFILSAGLILYLVPIGFDVMDDLAHIVAQSPEVSSSFGEFVRFYTTASYWQILQHRILMYLHNYSQSDELISHLDQLAFFLLGLYTDRKNYISTFAKESRFWLRVLFFTFCIFALGFLLDKTWLTNLSKLENPELPLAIEDVVTEITRFFQVFVYIIGFLWLLTVPRIRLFFAPLANIGRMALTGYLMHTIVFSFLFYSFGLHLFGALAPVQLVIVASGYYLMFAFLSLFWLNHFLYGPFEWVWRSLTYGKVLPFRKQTE
jgi:uncharacterized protein